MRKISVLLFTLFAITVAGQDSAVVVRIGYIDKQLFINAMPEMQEVQSNLKKLQTEYEKEFNAMTGSYNDRIRKYLEQKDDMSEAIKLARQTEITELELTIDLYKRRYLADLESKRKQLVAPIVAAIDEAIKAVAQSLSLTIVFDQSTPLYTSEQCVDITDAVGLQLQK